MIRLQLPLYKACVISHSYCEHRAVVTLAGGDIGIKIWPEHWLSGLNPGLNGHCCLLCDDFQGRDGASYS